MFSFFLIHTFEIFCHFCHLNPSVTKIDGGETIERQFFENLNIFRISTTNFIFPEKKSVIREN